MAQTIFSLYPANNLWLGVILRTVDPTTGALTPLATGTVVAFLATSNSPTATAADASLNATVSYIGQNGLWLVQFTGAQLDPTLLNTLFSATTPYVIVQQVGTTRIAQQLSYAASRPAGS